MSITMNNLPEVGMERTNDGYECLLEGIRQSFAEPIVKGEPLFTTNVTDLYDIFLAHLPEQARQHYNCNTCRGFVNRYGGLVTIDDEGYIYPVMWAGEWPEFFEDAIANVHMAVSHAKVNGVFVTSDKRLGMPKTGIWHHMAVDVPKSMIHRDRLNTAYQAACARHEEFKMLMAATQKYQTSTVETAVNLLRSDSLYRGERFLKMAEWFLKIKQLPTNRYFANILWKESVKAPAGFCHISSSVIGTLLDDIEAGLDFEAIKVRFNEKMNPLQYQRPQVAPGAGNVKRAEEIVAKLGIANSLKRRFARLEDIETIWTPQVDTPKVENTGVFAGIKTKNTTPTKRNDIQAPATTMTWEKFQRTVLPMAKKIEVFVGRGSNYYAAIVTAEDFDAPPIIAWDSEAYRNPCTWYVYNGGSYPTSWNLVGGTYAEVTAVALQPNMWQPGFDHHGGGVFFILKGCKDTHNVSAALFPELLRGELREVRATIEAYSRANKLGGQEEASACGLRLQKTASRWDCTLRVTTDVGVSMYKLDRWD